MISNIKDKIRALIFDISKSDFETFTYTTTNIFTITQTNITISKVLLNGEEIEDYTFDEDTNKITIQISGLESGDLIEVDYLYTKYSDTELNEYIRASLVWISVFSYNPQDYELAVESGSDDVIYPTPDNRTSDLIALIASIIIKPDFSQYSLPNVKIVYPRTMVKEDRIEKLIKAFNKGLGINGTLNFDEIM